MSIREVAYLGPPGTYAHLVAEKRYGRSPRMVPLPSILEVCTYVSRHSDRRGIVPIENSSGGALYETVDILMSGKPRVRIECELALQVRLALLGQPDRDIRTLYSHFVPIEHCTAWIKRRLPRVRKEVTSSTAAAAQCAADDPHGAALGSRRLARMYGLRVLEHPIEADIPNLTVFLAVGGRVRLHPNATKTTLAVKVPNEPGSLCTFLEAFRDHKVNLSRLISRPIRGCPRQYAFLVDIDGSAASPKVKRALAVARKRSVEIKMIGSYPSRGPYKS